MVTVAIKLKKHLLSGRKVMTNLDSMLKNSNITHNGGVEGHALSSPARTPKLQLTAEQLLTGESCIPPNIR